MTDRRPMKRMVRSFMHEHPRRDRGLVSVMAIMAPIGLLLMVALMPLHVENRARVAATGPLAVDGTVYSPGDSPVVGATVYVNILNGIVLRTNQSATSDANGFYTVSIDPGLWDVGNTIVVVAIYNTLGGENITVAIDTFEMTVDVHLGTTGIPELGGPAVTVLTVSAIGMMVVFYAGRRGSISP